MSKIREKESLECVRMHIWAPKTQKLPGPLSRPWTPAAECSLRSRDSAMSATFGLRSWGPPLDQILDPHLHTHRGRETDRQTDRKTNSPEHEDTPHWRTQRLRPVWRNTSCPMAFCGRNPSANHHSRKSTDQKTSKKVSRMTQRQPIKLCYRFHVRFLTSLNVLGDEMRFVCTL